MNKGTLVVLSGPSGVGKTTLCKKILDARQDIRYSVSATSRPIRRGEEDGREYIFLSGHEFEEWIKLGKFIEYAEVHGSFYGTPKAALEDMLCRGFNVLMDVDVTGARNLMKLYPDALYFFIIPPDFRELEQRLKKRNTERDDAIKNRLCRALEELQYKNDFKHIIENRDIDETVKRILTVISTELKKP